MDDRSLSASYFDALYARRPDPWSFATSPYERAKYDATLAALDRERYGSALEIGCSIGVLTRRLAARCERLLALDVSEHALAAARARCADRAHVRFERGSVPQEFPAGRFELVVLSEVGYYWSVPDLDRARDRIAEALTPGGALLLVHYLPDVPEYPGTGDDVHARFLADARFAPVRSERAELFRLDLLRAA